MVAQERFRSDLYYRLNVFPITLPPLRERPEDIPDLVRHFVEIFSRRIRKRIDHIPAETMVAFQSYLWPGNILELQNFVERAAILARDSVLPSPLPATASISIITTATSPRSRETQRVLISKTLDQVGWVKGGPHGAAAKLGLKRTTLLARMKKLGMSRIERKRTQNCPAYTHEWVAEKADTNAAE